MANAGMPDTARAAKRPRSQSPSATSPKQHPMLWFPRGDIILDAGQTRFKVHQDVLALHSVVFKDMFQLPSTLDGVGNEQTKGCPVVKLHDEAKDVENMLLAIYHKRPYSLNHEPPIPFVLSLLRMETKYIVETLREEASELFREAFTDKLDELQPLYEVFANPDIFQNTAIEAEDDGKDNPLVAFLMDIANVGETVGLSLTLPFVLYSIGGHPSDILAGITGADACRHYLSPSNLTRWITGWEKIVKVPKEGLFVWLPEGSPKCSIPNCSTLRLELCLELVTTDNLDLFGPWDDDWDETGICSSCLAYGKLKYQEAKEKIWEELPTMYGLAPWSELRARAAQ